MESPEPPSDSWRWKIGKEGVPGCRYCGEAAETGDHLVFECKKWKGLRKEVWIEQEGGGEIGKIWAVATSGSSRIREMRRASS